MLLEGFLGSTMQCKSMLREYIFVDDLESLTATISMRHLKRFCNRVTDVILNYKSVKVIKIDSSDIENGRFLIIIDSCLSDGS